MAKALGKIGITAGAILLITGFLTVFAVTGTSLTASFLAIPIIFIVVGALLIAYGKRSTYRSKAVSTKEPEKVTIEPKTIFCRYCGSENDSGGNCHSCGNSSQSTSTIMKICRTCFSTMDEDSQYCTHCGMKFL